MSNVNQEVATRAESNTNLKMLSGLHTGQVKWFNRRRGYGFIKIIQSHNSKETHNENDNKNETNNESFIGKDVFVHQSHIKPHKSTYRSLEENEYVELGLSVDDKNVTQAVNVTGILGGSLLCDVHHERHVSASSLPEEEPYVEGSDFSTPKYHQRRGRNYRGSKPRLSPSVKTETVNSTSSRNDRGDRGDRVDVSGGGNYFSKLE